MALSTTAPPDHFDTGKQMSLSFEASFFSMKEDLGTYIISTMNIGDKDIPGRCCVPCWCVKIWQSYYSANKCDFWLKVTSHSIFASFLSLCTCLWALGRLLSCMLWNIHVIYRQYPVISQWLKCRLERWSNTDFCINVKGVSNFITIVLKFVFSFNLAKQLTHDSGFGFATPFNTNNTLINVSFEFHYLEMQHNHLPLLFLTWNTFHSVWKIKKANLNSLQHHNHILCMPWLHQSFSNLITAEV